MMSSRVLGIVLLVSAAHAMAHVYELSLPSVEKNIADEFRPGQVEAGKQLTGRLGTTWRVPWGFGALLAGWLVDRWGGRRMLAVYLLGCGLMCLVAGFSLPLAVLFVVMFAMGSAASIYHPAGLALISHETTIENRPRALGIHGVFGSLGIALAPFLAGVLLTAGMSWRGYYWGLAAPGFVLGIVFLFSHRRHARQTTDTEEQITLAAAQLREDEHAHWPTFFALTGVIMLSGIIYSAAFHFLPRYLIDAGFVVSGVTAEQQSKYLAAAVLLLGCVGQYVSGRIATPARLEWQLAWIALANAPCLVWMSLATGWQRVAAAGLFALVHFMIQPVYNTLVAKYTPRSRRSTAYGVSNAIGFGIGALGPLLAGYLGSLSLTYAVLAGVAVASGVIAGGVVWRTRK